jgi:tetratricopeptide (TPR) repeat protein
MEPAKLTRLVRGDLDWIVMKCLEKDRNRRYETPGALAKDIQRYLQEEPVQACPPSAMYRFRKFVRRNRPAIAVAVVVGMSLGAVAVMGTQAHQSQQQRLTDQKAHEGQLRAERQQHVLEKASMAAMSADFEGAEEAINEAELLGASAGQVRMLRGQVAFHRGDMETAIGHLEQGVRLLPAGQGGGVAARALLALACLNASFQLPRFAELSRELDGLLPITPEDFLFKGLLETTIRPERGLRTLDEGIRRGDSVVARATRLEARANRAMVTGKVEDAELALEDAQVAQRMLPGNALVLARSVFAHLVTATVYETDNRPEDSQRVLAQAGRLVKELEQFSAIPYAAKACFEYFEYVGDDEAALAISGQANGFRRAVMLYRGGEFSQALDAAVERNRSRAAGPTQQIEPGLILAELPDGPARALRAFEEIRSASWPLAPPLILLFLGKPAEAQQAFLQVPTQELPPWDDGWWFRCLDYLCGRITAEQLLQAAAGARPKLSDAHFLIGLWRLSEGERTAAQEQFRKCVATRAFDSWHWPWVRAFLARMEQDPAWPSWIPLKE